jgi:regulator of protease activity HflC (stomatin/prohibitin superfamily)
VTVVAGVAAIVVAAGLAASVRIVREYERAVVFRLGRLLPVEGPGLVALVPGVEIPEARPRAMARQAEAERERRAKVINAEGECC